MATGITLNEMLQQIQKWINGEPAGHALWDVITGLRGPDRGQGEEWSERPVDSKAGDVSLSSRRYSARVNRKMRTVAIIRAKALGNIPGARIKSGEHVTLPPQNEWDHFDKHVARAAQALGLGIKELTK